MIVQSFKFLKERKIGKGGYPLLQSVKQSGNNYRKNAVFRRPYDKKSGAFTRKDIKKIIEIPHI